MNGTAIFKEIKTTLNKWNTDKATQIAAALSFYTMFSAAPLLIVAIAVAGLIFGQEAARNQIVTQIQGVVGKEGAIMVQTMIQNATQPGSGVLATILGIVTLLLGAAGAFAQIKGALNQIWGVAPPPSKGFVKDIIRLIRQEFVSFAMVMGTGFLLLLSLMLSTILSGVSSYLPANSVVVASVGELLNFIISFVIITLLFAAIYKILPDVRIAWRDVWIGALISALLITIGKFLIGLYLSHGSIASTYGAAGSLVVILVWVNYSAQLFFLGAEFTCVYANSHGKQSEVKTETMKSEQPVQTQIPPNAEKAEATRKTYDKLIVVSRIVSIIAPALIVTMRVWVIINRFVNLFRVPDEDKINS